MEWQPIQGLRARPVAAGTHTSVAESIKCLVQAGGCFIRACELWVQRSLNESKFGEFLVALKANAMEFAG